MIVHNKNGRKSEWSGMRECCAEHVYTLNEGRVPGDNNFIVRCIFSLSTSSVCLFCRPLDDLRVLGILRFRLNAGFVVNSNGHLFAGD